MQAIWTRRTDCQPIKEAMPYFDHDEYDKVSGISVRSQQLRKQLVEAAELTVDGRKHLVKVTMWYDVEFKRHLIGGPSKTGAITIIPPCSSCTNFGKDDFIWCVT